MKIVSIDIETTGLDPQKCDILEFGAIIDDLNNLKLEVQHLPRFHCYFLPVNDGMYLGSPYALSMHPTIFRRIAKREEGFTYTSPNKFGFMFQKFLLDNGFTKDSNQDRVVINVAGKNPSFDISFLENKTDVCKFVGLRHRVVDPSILFLNRADEAIPGTSELKKRLGMDEHVAHTALADAEDIINVIRYAVDTNRMFIG